MSAREQAAAEHPDPLSSTSSKKPTRLWGGRFLAMPSTTLDKVNRSISFDWRLWKADIDGSIAYVKALQLANVINAAESKELGRGLQLVKDEWENGIFEIQSDDEDVHTANERRLTELIGDVGGKLHTGRSRNDQVVTDLKLWLRCEVRDLERILLVLLEVLVNRAERELDVLMPGYTHLQRAQPVRWSHFLMSHAVAFKRDLEQLQKLLPELDILPLGSGAIAGNSLEINREYIASLLAFSSVTVNSMDAVSDRDFVVHFLTWAAVAGVHLSRLAEDLILYSTKEFRFVSLSDDYSTGSSLMPHKRNPDSLELLRGKSGRLIGNAFGFMTTLKGLPSCYNKDLQEDKEPLFDSADQIKMMLELAFGIIDTLRVDPAACKRALSLDMLATDVAYYLVRKGIPFREAHHIVGRVVALTESKHCHLNDLSLEELQNVNAQFDKDYYGLFNFEKSVEQYSSTGGTAHAAVWQQIATVREFILNIKSGPC